MPSWDTRRAMRAVVEVNDLTLEGPPFKVTISAGVADTDSIRDQSGSPEDALTRAADQALYQAKDGGRNRVVLYGAK